MVVAFFGAVIIRRTSFTVVIAVTVVTVVVGANRAGQSGFERRVEYAEVDVVEVQFGQQMNGHPVGNDPQVVESVDFDVAREDHGFVVVIDDAQVCRFVRQSGIPTADGVPVDQVEQQCAVVVHVMGGHVTAGASGFQDDKVVVDFFGRDLRVAQEFRGHGEFAVAGQRMEEQQAETVGGERRQRDAEHSFFSPLEVYT